MSIEAAGMPAAGACRSELNWPDGMGLDLDNLIDSMRLADVLDIVVIAVLIFVVLQWLRNRASRAVATGLFLMAALYITADVYGMYLTLSAIQIGFTAIAIALVIVFQRDIRRGFERLSLWQLFDARPGGTSSQTVDTLMEAISALAEQKIGALFVIQGRQPVESFIRGGVNVHGEISLPLLMSIFHPASPGHDGAVLIEGDRLEKLGAHLPLSKNLDDVGRSGTRHAAALGMSECCDALVIAVSEELGTISVAEQSRLQVVGSAAELKQRLEAFYAANSSHPKSGNWGKALVRDSKLKALALASACVMWFLFVYDDETVQRTFNDVAIEFRNVPEGWVVQTSHPSKAEVTLSGSGRAFDEFDAEELSVSLDLSEIRERQEISLSEDQLDVPSGLDVEQLEPSTVSVLAERLVPVELPVTVVLSNPETVADRNLVAVAEPKSIPLLVPSSERASLQTIRTEPIDSAAVVAGRSIEARLVLPPRSKFLAGEEPELTVRFESRSAAES